MKKTYSRLASVEERRNLKRALLFIVLTIATIVLLFFVGIPALGKFTAFVSDFKKTTKVPTKDDTTPPPPPKFNSFQDFTNIDSVAISGTDEPGVTVKVIFNGTDSENVVDKDGIFSFNFKLISGENIFSAIATDASGNQSQPSKEYKIIYDNKVPDLTLDSPSDGAQFYGSNQRQVTVQGTTEVGASITINERIIFVDDNGKFQYTTTLSDGQNNFKVKSTDQAGNITEKELILNFTP